MIAIQALKFHLDLLGELADIAWVSIGYEKTYSKTSKPLNTVVIGLNVEPINVETHFFETYTVVKYWEW